MIEKQRLINLIIEKLKQELANAVNSANQAHLAATDDQSVAETQYDTLGIEASYLAHGQSERAAMIQQQITSYESLVCKSFKEEDEIALTAIVGLDNNKQKLYFIGPHAGGLQLKIDNKIVNVITPTSPLAEQLIGLSIYDEIRLPNTNNLIEISAVY